MTDKTITPTLGAKSFTCSVCGALSHQTWYSVFLKGFDKGAGPWVTDLATIENLKNDNNFQQPQKDELIKFFKRKLSKMIFSEVHGEYAHLDSELVNLNISQCYSCSNYAIWVADNLIYPPSPTPIVPNEEMPDPIRSDFNEAVAIIDKSPRGAAALLRLGIQKLMTHLGLKGKSIDDDIGELVRRGLDDRIQKALVKMRREGLRSVSQSCAGSTQSPDRC